MIGRAAQGRPWFPGQVARYLATGKRERTPPLAEQFTLINALYDEMLAHHGLTIGRRHARKHLAWALDSAAASAGIPIDLLKNHRARVLTAEEPAKTRRLLADAYDAFAWRAAA
jgi:tRNA-dihydrouridine synthase